MSESPSPPTPPTNTLPSNAPAYPKTALIVLMNQTLHQKATMMVHFQAQSPPTLVPMTLISPTYKIKRPPFPKWDGIPTTKPQFLAQVATNKSEAHYSGVTDWTNTTLDDKNVSAVISDDMTVSLPRTVFPMLLNDTRFSSDGITMTLYLLTHIKYSSSETSSSPFQISLALRWD